MMRLGSFDSTRHIGARYDFHFCYTYRTTNTQENTEKTHFSRNVIVTSSQNVVSTEPRPSRSQRRKGQTHGAYARDISIAIASRVEHDCCENDTTFQNLVDRQRPDD